MGVLLSIGGPVVGEVPIWSVWIWGPRNNISGDFADSQFCFHCGKNANTVIGTSRVRNNLTTSAQPLRLIISMHRKQLREAILPSLQNLNTTLKPTQSRRQIHVSLRLLACKPPPTILFKTSQDIKSSSTASSSGFSLMILIFFVAHRSLSLTSFDLLIS